MHDNIYSDDFFDQNETGSVSSAKQIVPILVRHTNCRSVVDVGCARGHWLKEFKQIGVEDIFGIDGSYVNTSHLVIPKERFQTQDLSKPIPLERTFDLAICLEVAEHLPSASAGEFVRFLTSLAPIVAFSAAIPGQGGDHHINEQWPEYWASIFRIHGFCSFDCLRLHLWSNPNIKFWYAQNIILYIRKDVIGAYPTLNGAIPTETPLSLVHPDCLRDALVRPATDAQLNLRRAVTAIPRLFWRAIHRRLSPSGPKSTHSSGIPN